LNSWRKPAPAIPQAKTTRTTRHVPAAQLPPAARLRSGRLVQFERDGLVVQRFAESILRIHKRTTSQLSSFAASLSIRGLPVSDEEQPVPIGMPFVLRLRMRLRGSASSASKDGVAGSVSSRLHPPMRAHSSGMQCARICARPRATRRCRRGTDARRRVSCQRRVLGSLCTPRREWAAGGLVHLGLPKCRRPARACARGPSSRRRGIGWKRESVGRRLHHHPQGAAIVRTRRRSCSLPDAPSRLIAARNRYAIRLIPSCAVSLVVLFHDCGCGVAAALLPQRDDPSVELCCRTDGQRIAVGNL